MYSGKPKNFPGYSYADCPYVCTCTCILVYYRELFLLALIHINYDTNINNRSCTQTFSGKMSVLVCYFSICFASLIQTYLSVLVHYFNMLLINVMNMATENGC